MMLDTSFDWTAIPQEFATAAPVVVPAPALPAMTITPFGYQARAFEAVWNEFDSGRKATFVAMATGLGKSILGGMIAREAIRRGGRVLFLAHRDELLEGAQSEFAKCGVATALEKADRKARPEIERAARDHFDPRDIQCVVGSVQSLHEKNLATWCPDYFDLIITDEAHHSVRSKGPKKRRATEPSPQYGAIYRRFENAKLLGLTGSPRRKDGAELGFWYESVAYQYLLKDAIDAGDLCRVTLAECDVTVDLTKVNMGAEDLNQGDLEDAITPYIEEMVNAIKAKVGDRRFVLFSPGRKSVTQKVRPCEAFADGLRKVGITAKAVWGDHPDRLAIGRGFREGEFQGVCNADLYNEGVNFPFVEAIVLAAPTASPVVLGQRIGRGTRIYPGKQDCKILTFDWQFDEHKFSLVDPYHLVRPDGCQDAARIARDLVKSGKETDAVRAAEKAEEIVEEERRRKREEIEARARAREESEARKRERMAQKPVSLSVRERVSRLGFREVNPFGPPRKASGRIASPITDAQRLKLVNDYGCPEGEVNLLSREEADEKIAWCYYRHRENLAPEWLVRGLVRRGVDQNKALGFSRGQAFAVWNKLKNGEKRRA